MRRFVRALPYFGGLAAISFLLGPIAAPAQTVPSVPPTMALPSIAPMPPRPPLPKEDSQAELGLLESLAAAVTGRAKTEAAAPVPVQPGKKSGFDSAQRATVERINKYFNAIDTLTGNFVQVGPDGSKTEGEFYLQKPGKVRFDYDPPSPIELISDGSSVAVRDRKLATQDLYPLSQTPLRFLLSEHLDLFKDSNVVGVYQDELFITVVIQEEHPVVGTHRLMIMFGAQDSQLKQWTVTDPQGFDTTVAVYNLDRTHKPDPSLFRIDYQRVLQ